MKTCIECGKKKAVYYADCVEDIKLGYRDYIIDNYNNRLRSLIVEMISAMKANCETCFEYGGEECEECIINQVIGKAEQEVGM